MKILFGISGKERTSAQPIFIEDWREKGVSFREAVASYAQSNSLDPSRIEVGSSDRLFSEVKPFAHSEDGQHVLAIGRDEDRETLLKDGEPVLPGEYSSVWVAAKTPDLSRLVVGTRDEQDEESFYFVDELGKSKKLMQGRDLNLLWHAEHLERFWLSGLLKGETVFARFNMVGKCEVGFNLKRKFDFLYLRGISKDRRSIVWLGRRGSVDYLFQNDRLLTKGDKVMCKISPDLTRILTISERRGLIVGNEVRIMLNDKTIDGGFGRKAASFVADEEVTIAAIDLEYKRFIARRLFGLKGETLELSRPYDRLLSLRISDDGEQIVARVLRGDERRTLVIKREKVGQEPSQVIEERVTS